MPTVPSLPNHELERSRALACYAVLDTPAEPVFDRLTALAARLFDVPVALISLVDDTRLWFKSKQGLCLTEIARDQSFCAYTVLNEGVFVVPDASVDPRFAMHLSVAGDSHVRFYAGAPLKTSTGHNVGALALVGTEARSFSETEAATLSDLAHLVIEALEARRVNADLEAKIIEHQQIQAALREGEERLRLAMDTACLGTWDWNMQTGQVHWSPEHNVMYDLPPEQRIGTYEEWIERVHPEDRARAASELQSAIERHDDFACELRSLHRDGTIRWIKVNGRAFHAPDGQRVRTLGVVRDVTAQHRDAEVLRAARQDALTAAVEARGAAVRVQTVLESISDAFFSMDHEWRFTYVNHQAERLLRRPREELLGRSGWEEFPAVVGGVFDREHRATVARGEAVHYETFFAPLGVWLDIHVYPSPNGVSVYLQDISVRRRAQQELEDSHHLLQAVIDGTDNLIFLKDRAGRYLMSNPAMAASLGLRPADLLGKKDSVWFSPEEARHVQAVDQEVLRTDRPVTFEFKAVLGGVPRIFVSTKCPYRDARGNVLGVLGIVREITEQRRAAASLQQAKEEAERANLAKSEFLSRMSHELRTPLNAILGFGQLLDLGDLAAREQESVDHILSAGRHLLGLIDEVLAISRIEAGEMSLSLEPVSVPEIVAECLSLVSQQAAAREIRCENHCTAARDCHDYVLADRQRLRQVLLNLLSNASKYNRRGGQITVACHFSDGKVCGAPSGRFDPGLRPPSSPGSLRLQITDTGQGLSPEQMGRLFTPFERLDAENSRIEGTGLGLVVTKALVEVMGGEIGVESVLGQGSTFWLSLPLVADPALHLTVEHAVSDLLPSGSNHLGTVLHIEDNLSNLRLMEMLLEKRPGFELLSAQLGTSGLKIARARRPDLILLDLHLPDLPGWEVLSQIQADASLRDIPVVVISADATQRQIERLLKAGAREYLTKPVNISKLMHALDQHLLSTPL